MYSWFIYFSRLFFHNFMGLLKSVQIYKATRTPVKPTTTCPVKGEPFFVLLDKGTKCNLYLYYYFTLNDSPLFENRLNKRSDKRIWTKVQQDIIYYMFWIWNCKFEKRLRWKYFMLKREKGLYIPFNLEIFLYNDLRAISCLKVKTLDCKVRIVQCPNDWHAGNAPNCVA